MQQCRTGLLRTLAIPVLRGREFCSVAVKGSQPVVIVNETFGRAVFGHMEPVGHTIKPDFPDAKEQLIVGVVKDSEYFTLGEKQRLAAYEPYFISEEPTNLQFLIRTGGSPSRYVSRSTIFWAAWIRPLPWKQSR